MNAVRQFDQRPELRGILRANEPMSKHTVWGIGGPARRFYAPADVDDLCAFVASAANGEPLFWFGLGSNLLVRDGGIDATVIHTAAAADLLERVDAVTVRAGAGVACPKLARFAVRQGLRGCEFFAGIPGTVGGALAMNAGAFGGETWPIVTAVNSIDANGNVHCRPRTAYQARYRELVGPPGEWFVSADFVLEEDADKGGQARVKALLAQRAQSQPTGQRSCGSVFRNPPNDFAARLIESCGLKGERIGAAVVSEKHANFIVNVGGATAADVEALIARVRMCVEAETGVRLQPEVKVVGDALNCGEGGS